ncbi:sugar transferase (plasmid) [Nostoc sp. UHCC 0302]|uniref:sugar transferase n=1 Tax=Nostoc sp. UHCC 0302 TaxID=3134896 RepID=UPI00311C9835
MNNQNIAINHKISKSSKAYLDLRAPAFFMLRREAWQLLTLVLVDYTLLSLAWLLAEYHTDYVHLPWDAPNNYIRLLITSVIQIGLLFIQGSYQADQKHYDYLNLIKSITFAHGLILLISCLYKPIIEVNQPQLLFSLGMSITFICTGRVVFNITLEYLKKKQKSVNLNPAFIICNPESSEEIISMIRRENRYTIGGIAGAKALDKNSRRATLEKLKQLNVTEVFVSWDAIKNRMFVCWLFHAYGITIYIVPMELKPTNRDLKSAKLGGINCLTFSCPIIPGKDFLIKRVFDICATTLLLMLLFPVYVAIAIAIKLDSPGLIFFKQTRIGLHGRPFKVWKFRTMRYDAEKLQKELEALNETKDGILFKIKDDPRITRIGKFLRRYSLDELPQLFNVLRGEMSLVGPRPLPTRDVDKFSEHHFIRHEILPGITGLWQVSGRSEIIDFEKVIDLDIRYIENWSLQLDLDILFKTVMVILKKKGAY